MKAEELRNTIRGILCSSTLTLIQKSEALAELTEDYAEKENPLGKTIVHKKIGTKVSSLYKVLGVRTECSSNNNTMYLIRHENDQYFWVYDYEVKFKKVK